MRRLVTLVLAVICVLATTLAVATPATADDSTTFDTNSASAALLAGADPSLLPGPCEEIGCGEPDPAPPQRVRISCYPTLEGPDIAGSPSRYIWGRARITCTLYVGYGWESEASMYQLTVLLTMYRSTDGIVWTNLGTWTATTNSRGSVEISHSAWCGLQWNYYYLQADYVMIPPYGFTPPARGMSKTSGTPRYYC